MKISVGWLREWVSVDQPPQTLADLLTMAGLEVDAVEDAAPPLADVVVGEIVACAPHPDADRLQICEVRHGDAVSQVVCGAPNARPGLSVPLALPGARLPGDVTIGRASVRGVESHGMLCSARELGLGDAAGGLLELPSTLTSGEPLRDAMALDDTIIDVDLTPNRGDCLGMLGIAREVAALTGSGLCAPEDDPVTPTHDRRVPVRLDAPEDCPRYLCRVITGVDPTAETPIWMVERLRRSGVRSLGPVVDVTNYVMLELGQPMHGFDLDRIDQSIVVRRAVPGEQLTLLNGEIVEPDAETLLITDASGPLALAGIMGGEPSAVSTTTRDILLESAFFSPTSVIGRARRHGLHTDSSHRFERGVDPALQRQAMERATRLLLAIAGGDPGPVNEAVADQHLPQPRQVQLRQARIERLLGVSLPAEQVETILRRLGLVVHAAADEGRWVVDVPSWRFDIALEEDLIEELARIHGYDRIPPRFPAAPARIAARPEQHVGLTRVRSYLTALGFDEAINYAFGDPDEQRQLDPVHAPVMLANPLSADLSAMRTTLLPGLLRAVRHNLHRQQDRLRFFETGVVFRGELPTLAQTPMLGLALCGRALPEQWAALPPGRQVDFFDLKGVVEGLLALRGQNAEPVQCEVGTHPALHPGQAAVLRFADGQQGWLGALHPRVARALELDVPVFVAELPADVLQLGGLPRYRGLSRYPSVRRDLALLVADAVSAAAVVATIRRQAEGLLQDVIVFDEYRGEGVPEGFRSLAVGLTMQDSARTLTDEDGESVVERILSALDVELGVRMRG